jgi:hypothetical protein
MWRVPPQATVVNPFGAGERRQMYVVGPEDSSERPKGQAFRPQPQPEADPPLAEMCLEGRPRQFRRVGSSNV